VAHDLSFEDISVIVQGPVVGAPDHLTRRCLASVRQHLPGAELVLSTWQGSDTGGLEYDLLVPNQDPGAPPYVDLPHLRNNVNRRSSPPATGSRRRRGRMRSRFART